MSFTFQLVFACLLNLSQKYMSQMRYYILPATCYPTLEWSYATIEIINLQTITETKGLVVIEQVTAIIIETGLPSKESFKINLKYLIAFRLYNVSSSKEKTTNNPTLRPKIPNLPAITPRLRHRPKITTKMALIILTYIITKSHNHITIR